MVEKADAVTVAENVISDIQRFRFNKVTVWMRCRRPTLPDRLSEDDLSAIGNRNNNNSSHQPSSNSSRDGPWPTICRMATKCVKPARVRFTFIT
jgi:hypothetical protein